MLLGRFYRATVALMLLHKVLLGLTLAWGVGLAVLWASIAFEIYRDATAWHQRSLSDAENLATVYARQLQKSIDQIDQLSVMLVHARERGDSIRQLTAQYGVFQSDSPFYPFFADENGIVKSARNTAALGHSVGHESFFSHHRDDASTVLSINPRAPGFAVLSGKEVVRFSRRVNKPDGRFGGVIAISVPPSYLDLVDIDSVTNNGNFASVWLTDGQLLSNWTAGFNAVYQPYTAFPGFVSNAGAALEPAEKFRDPQSRYVGWKFVDRYPLIVLHAVNEKSALRFVDATKQTYLLAGLLGTVLIISGWGLSVWRHRRREAQREHASRIQSTFRLAIDGSNDEFFMVMPVQHEDGSTRFRIEDCSEQVAKMSGRKREFMLGKTFDELLPQVDARVANQFLQATLRAGFYEREVEIWRTGLQKRVWFNCRAVCADQGIALTLRDISDTKEKEKQLKLMALTDALTLLPNRHWLNQFLSDELDSLRAAGKQIALFYLDLDDFKKINDTLGHKVGDHYLESVAQILRQAVRQGDHVVRLGGDEFTILVEHGFSQQNLDTIATNILHELHQLDTSAFWRGFQPSASMGVALFPVDATNAVDLLQAADIAMYEAKLMGKGQVVHYNVAMAEKYQARLQMERALQRAILENEFLLYFQPRVAAVSGTLLSFEALLRWQHPQQGLVAPGSFIELAESSNLIVEIGDWVASQACVQMADWRALGLPSFHVSINVSARQLRTSQFRHHLATAMSTHGVLSSELAIELTESTMVGSDAVVLKELQLLREMGIKLDIDDFGTGYSSLSQLQRLDVDAIKIDQSFVKALDGSGEGHALCDAMVKIGKALGIAVVAEGVETVEQLRQLQQMGCDEIQGYFISPPVPAEAVTALVRQLSFSEPYAPKLRLI